MRPLTKTEVEEIAVAISKIIEDVGEQQWMDVINDSLNCVHDEGWPDKPLPPNIDKILFILWPSGRHNVFYHYEIEGWDVYDVKDQSEELTDDSLLAAVQTASQISSEDDPYPQLVYAMMCIEKEEGVEALKQVLAEGLAAACSKTNGQGTSNIIVNQEFVTANIAVQINK